MGDNMKKGLIALIIFVSLIITLSILATYYYFTDKRIKVIPKDVIIEGRNIKIKEYRIFHDKLLILDEDNNTYVVDVAQEHYLTTNFGYAIFAIILTAIIGAPVVATLWD